MIVINNKDVFVNLGNGKVLIKYKNNISLVSENVGDIGIKIGTVVIKWKTSPDGATVQIEPGQAPSFSCDF